MVQKLQSKGKPVPPCRRHLGGVNGKNIAQEGKDWVQIRSYFILGLRRASHVFIGFPFSFVNTDITIRGVGKGLWKREDSMLT